MIILKDQVPGNPLSIQLQFILMDLYGQIYQISKLTEEQRSLEFQIITDIKESSFLKQMYSFSQKDFIISFQENIPSIETLFLLRTFSISPDALRTDPEALYSFMDPKRRFHIANPGLVIPS